MAPRVLLLEFVGRDPAMQRRGELFPYAHGWARAQALAVRWLVLGADPRPPPASPFLVALDEADTAALAAAVRDFAPGRVLHGDALDPALEAALRAAAPEARFVFAADLPDLRVLQTRQLAETLGGAAPAGPDAEQLALDGVEPHFGCERFNDAARRREAWIPVVVGPLCFYSRSLRANPLFAGVDLAGVRPGACSFCGEPDPAQVPRPRADPVHLAVQQVRRARETAPSGGDTPTFRVLSSAVFLRLEEFFAGVLAAGLGPSRFLFTCRVNEFRKRLPALRACLPRLADAGHVLGVEEMGVESFSDAENERFNKGLRAADAFAAWDAACALEREFPGTFRFRDWGGFSFIVFTPWTTPADLRANVDGARRLGLGNRSSFWTRRLQLRPGRAITRLAEKDGLLLERRDLTALRTGDPVCLAREDDVALQWRFRDARTATILRLLELIAGAPADPADPLLCRVREGPLGQLAPEVRVPGRLLPLLLELVEQGLADPEALLAEVERRTAGWREAAPPPSEPGSVYWLFTHLRRVLAGLAAHPARPLGAFRVASCDYSGPRLECTLESESGERLLLHLQQGADPAAVHRTSHLSVHHGRATPPDTPWKRRALRWVADSLERRAWGPPPAGPAGTGR